MERCFRPVHWSRPGGFELLRLPVAPGGKRIEHQHGGKAEQEGADDEGAQELPDGNARRARHDQFVTAVERDQRGHAGKQRDEGHRLHEDRRDAQRRDEKADRDRIMRQRAGAVRHLAEIDDEDQREDAEQEPHRGGDVAAEEIEAERANHELAPPPAEGVPGLMNRESSLARNAASRSPSVAGISRLLLRAR